MYGFNLLLLPVNLAGVAQSIGQAIGGHKIAFARTPKVRNRTVAPLTYVVLPYVLVLYSLYTLWGDIDHARYLHAGFAGVNVAMAGYAIIAFIGLRHSIVDIILNLWERMHKPPRHADVEVLAPDWATVLYHGSADPHEAPASAQATTLALLDQTHGQHPVEPVEAAHAGAVVDGYAPGRVADWHTVVHAADGDAPPEVARLVGNYLRGLQGVTALEVWADADGVHVRPRSGAAGGDDRRVAAPLPSDHAATEQSFAGDTGVRS